MCLCVAFEVGRRWLHTSSNLCVPKGQAVPATCQEHERGLWNIMQSAVVHSYWKLVATGVAEVRPRGFGHGRSHHSALMNDLSVLMLPEG